MNPCPDLIEMLLHRSLSRMADGIHFVKYQALGNDYLVVEPVNLPVLPIPKLARWMCDRNYGAGSDGLLMGVIEVKPDFFTLRIFNPDGSEAEKSGNGLRIFARYLWDQELVEEKPFDVETLGGSACCQVLSGGRQVLINMGKASFDSQDIPVAGAQRQVIDEIINVSGENLHFTAVSLGNPHSVILTEQVSSDWARRLGPLIERDDLFPQRTNVQFLQVMDRANLRIEIWERSAGYTLSSGSSACAAASVAYRLGLCDMRVTVHMPGGSLDVSIGKDGMIELTGPVTRVLTGSLDQEGLEEYLSRYDQN